MQQPAESLKRIRRIEFKTRRLVSDLLSGAYESRYKGRGVMFASVRPYEPGDDIRTMDWKVTARTGSPHIRQSVEERELTVMLVLDGSASLVFGTVDRQKREAAAEVCALLALVAMRKQDRVGLVVFTEQLELYIPPRKGRTHLLRLIQAIMTFQPSGTGSDLTLALRRVQQALRAGAIVFVLSDFLMPTEQYSRTLSILARKHQVSALCLTDPLESNMPNMGLTVLQDAETGAVEWLDTASPQWQAQFQQQQAAFLAERTTAFQRARVNLIEMQAGDDPVRVLMRAFRKAGT
jgi:uncharacterized protein (DUF58 family)